MLYRLVSHIPHILFKPVYDAYESYLLEKVKSGNIPKHVAIIMDGNRRWARKLEKPPGTATYSDQRSSKKSLSGAGS